MGDRTTVTLSIHNNQVEAALAAVPDLARAADEWRGDPPLNLAGFLFYEVNYGELDFLDELQQAGIAYDSEWDAGGEYTAGCESCRFTPEGEVEIKEVYTADRNPELVKLIELIDDHTALKAYILQHQQKVVSLPWDRQEEYGKIYRAKQLIQGKQ